MGNITDKFNLTYRDFEVDGVSGSGAHEPLKSDIREIGQVIEAAVSAVATAGLASVSFATKAAMDADLAHDAGTVAIVYADPTTANNDLYVKLGASGAGSWAATNIISSLITGLVQPSVDLAQAWAEGTLPGGGGTKSAKEWSNLLSAIVESIGDELGAIHRFRWGDRLLSYYDALDAAFPGIFRIVAGAVLPAAKTFLDDDELRPLKDRIPGTLFEELAAIHRFRWGDRMVAYFDPNFSNAPGAFKPVAGAVLPAALTFLDDAPDTPLLERLTGAASVSDLVTFGHSFQSDASGGSTYPARVAAALGVTVENFGIGGQTSTQIACRAGAISSLLTITGDQIPASGPVTVTALSSRLLSTPATTSATRTITGYLGGIHGTLTCVESGSGDSFDAYTFTRTTAGTAVNISSKEPFIPDIWTKSKRLILQTARNDIGDLTGNLDRLAAFVALIPHDQWVIVGEWPGGTEPSGSAGYGYITAWNDALAAKYGKHFVEIHHYAVAHGLSDLGLTPTGQDITDIANDVVPTSLRDSSSDIHPNDDGLTIIANRVIARLNFLATGA